MIEALTQLLDEAQRHLNTTVPSDPQHQYWYGRASALANAIAIVKEYTNA